MFNLVRLGVLFAIELFPFTGENCNHFIPFLDLE